MTNPGEFSPEFFWIGGLNGPGAQGQGKRSGNSHGGSPPYGHCLYRAYHLFRGGAAKEFFLVRQYPLIEYRHRVTIPVDWR
jgi:hypothetical protein